VSLQAPEKVRKLQKTLHAKAKESPELRFYLLYDKVYRADVLDYAYRCCKANGGAPGVDGEDFAGIETYGRQKWLGELAEELRNKSYRAKAIRRVYIPKPDGGQRPLGIPTVRDRVVQTAAVLVLAPIYEADLQDEQYAYREGRNALDAIRQVHSLVNTGHTEVIDADLSGYFDSIPHTELMKSVARRISDRHMLKLIKMWLKVPVEERDHRGRLHRSNPARRTGRGTPQGSPISPLLSNIYMRRFVLGWKTLGYEQRLQARIVNYADDFVICCRGTAVTAMQATRRLMDGLKLTINEQKTQTRRLPEESIEFLGYEVGTCYSIRNGKRYIGTRPSRKRIKRVCQRISELTRHTTCLTPVEERVTKLNHVMRGWANYFCLGPVSKGYHSVDAHARYRLREWLRHKHKVKGRGTARYPDEYLYGTLGLVRLEQTTRNLPWAKA
jgi:RNA-directed DNA polymerase